MRKFLTSTRHLLQAIELGKQPVYDFELLVLCVELAERFDDVSLDA
jgi:hypothetical protein